MFFTGYAVLKIQTVFIGMQVIIRNTDFAAFGDGDGDLTTFYRQNVEYYKGAHYEIREVEVEKNGSYDTREIEIEYSVWYKLV